MKHYFRKLLLMSAAVVAVTSVSAKPRTSAQMIQAAQSALQHGSVNLHRAPGTPVKTLVQNDAYTIYGYDDEGFAVIAADDLVPALLGVSSKKFTNNNENFNWWLRAVEEAVRLSVRHQQPLRASTPDDLGFEPVVGPLLTTEWDQDTPYNNYCPTSGYTHCLTGCVATAMAQVLNYHKAPACGIGQRTIYYPFENPSGQAVTADFGNHYYDWQNMRDTYKNVSYTNVEAHAVAELMRDCGVAAYMQYGTSAEGGSGAYSEDAADGLRKYFGFEDAECVTRYNYSERNWMALVYNELSEHGPVYYAGVDLGPFGGGHAFVIHGYREDGKVYVNWGWSGDDDGYYDIALLNPSYYEFSYGQDMIIGVYADPVNLIEKEVTLTKAGTLAEHIAAEEKEIVGTLKLSGQLNSDDLRMLREMCGCDVNGKRTKGHLHSLDLSGATFKEGGSAFLIDSKDNCQYFVEDNVLPSCAFYGCRQLKSLRLPANGIRHFGDGALALCYSLNEIDIKAAADADFILDENVVWNKERTEIIAVLPCAAETLDVPSGTTTLHDYALAGCARLVKVLLPRSITTIGREAFNGCSGLLELRFTGREVPHLTGSDVFKGVNNANCKLYVKRDMKTLFLRSAQWEYFNENNNIIEFGTAIKVNNKVRDYGEQNPIFTYQVLGDKVVGMPLITCEAVQSSPYGRYPIHIEAGDMNVGEEVDFIDGYLVVKKADLTVSIADATRAVGQPNPKFQLTFSGFKLGEDESVITVMPTVETTATSSSPAGEYEYRLVGGEAQNYEFVYDGKGVFTVTGDFPTAIRAAFAEGHPVDVYTLSGTLLRRVSSLDELPRGVYIIKGQKVVVAQ